VSLDYQRLAIIGVGLILLLLLWFLTHYTKVGLAFRGIAQDEQTALSMGIRSDWTAMLSVAFGSALAAVAAIIILPLSMINVNTGYDVLLIAMAVAVVGGLESFLGIIVASFILGYAQIITAHFFAPHWMMVMYLIAIMVILAIKPSGLFGKFKEIEERV
jgi:branched-chain amino acid transport system permease protein